MRAKGVRCACGLPLHYTDKEMEAQVTKLSEELGEYQPVQVGHEKYLVQRHYIALHGLKPTEFPRLLKEKVILRG